MPKQELNRSSLTVKKKKKIPVENVPIIIIISEIFNDEYFLKNHSSIFWGLIDIDEVQE